MMRPFSQRFPDVLNMQEGPYFSDENVTRARLTYPLPLRIKGTLDYKCWPTFASKSRDGEQFYKGWVFSMVRCGYAMGENGQVSVMPNFDYQILDVVPEKMDTDAFLTQFLAPTFERGQELLKSFGVPFSIKLPEHWNF
jgi:hypothetical protein